MNTHVVVIEELASRGSLLQHIVRQHSGRVDEIQGQFIFRQLIEAIMVNVRITSPLFYILQYLERNHIVHRDIKCDNIFLDNYANVKLGDFGFARKLRPGESSNTYCGSKMYAAPELHCEKRYTGNAIDIWSSGVVLYIMLIGIKF